MKLLFVTDLHGCEWKYDRLLDAARDFRADVVINGGDMLPKQRDLFVQGEFITDYLAAHFAQFEAAGIYYLCCLGNDDLGIFDELFGTTCAEYSFIVNLAQRRHIIGECEFIGMNWVVDYPFRLKDRCRIDTSDYVFQQQLGTALLSAEDGFKEIKEWQSYAMTLPTIEDELNQLPRPNSMGKAIYVIHMPPYGLGLDECGHGRRVGSKAVYDFLERNQPMLSLHGHIHESPEVSGEWRGRIGRTVCIQPGQSAGFTYVTIDLENMTMKRHTD